MTDRILGPTGSRKRRGFLVGPLLLAALLAVLFTAGAQAVHDAGAFELEGNATTDHGAGLPDDWDRVCHQVLGNDCSTSANTTGATAVSFTADGAQNATIFTTGGSKDPQDISNWQWKDQTGGLPDKDNLQDSFAARYSLPVSSTCPSLAATCELLYFGSDRFDNSGDAQQGFWLLQNRISLNSNGTFDSASAPEFHKVGDILIVTDFSNGGGTSTINIFEWVGSGGDTNDTLQSLGGGTNRTCGSSTNDSFCGIVNPTNGTTAPWPFTDKSGNSTYLNGELFEGGINLGQLSAAIANECFATFLSETRSSTSPTATLKDFVLGTFGNCVARMQTTPSTTSTSPGIPVHDTATVFGNNPTKTPSGSVEFFLCSFATGSTDVCDGSTGHVGTSIGSGTLSGSGGTASADSPDVNTAASPLTPGHYCFRAHWPGDSNYTTPLDFDGASECFEVVKIPSSTLTTPVDGSGVETHSITLGETIFDKAVVTGTAAGGDPTGEVNFFVCGPIASGTCSSGGTAVAGNPKTLVSDGNPATFTSSATSGGVTPTAVGRYCFRAEYGGSNVYLPSSDSGTGETECFLVNDTTSTTSHQTWLPNDSATVTSAHGAPLSGSLSFTLHEGSDCTGTVLRSAETFTFSGAASPVSRSTTNSSVTVEVTKSVSWEVVFASTDPRVSGSTRCETTSLTITN